LAGGRRHTAFPDFQPQRAEHCGKESSGAKIVPFGASGVAGCATSRWRFLGSNMAGDWAVGDFWGLLGNETRAWLDHLATGAPTVHTTPEQARVNLETTIAIERAVASGPSVRLPLQEE